MSANTVSVGRELLISTGHIVREWKEYYEELLSPIEIPSTEEAETGDYEVGPSRSHQGSW